jgi:hypothetical protein
MDKNQQWLYDKIDKLDSKLMKNVTKLQHHLEDFEADYHILNNKTTKILDQLSKSS